MLTCSYHPGLGRALHPSTAPMHSGSRLGRGCAAKQEETEMHTRMPRIASSVLGAWSCATLLLWVTACSPKPTSFSRGQSIPLGPYTVTVSHTESSSGGSFSGLGSSLSRPDAQVLVVYLDVQGAESVDINRTALWFMGFRAVDSEGNRHRGTPMPARQYNGMAAARSARSARDLDNWSSSSRGESGTPRDWVVLFAVPSKSHDFSMLMPNPKPSRGQPEAAIVPLGR